jgi:hypothetical protein
MLVSMRGQPPPSDEVEAQAVLDDYVAELRGRYDALSKLAGEVRGKYLWGFLTVFDGEGCELSEATAPSGAHYHLVATVWWVRGEVGGKLEVEAKLQEAAPPGGWLITAFELAPDGSVEVLY